MASVSSLNSNGLNFNGLVTGIDTSKIVDGLTAINRSRIATLESKKSVVAQKQATFVALQGKLFDLQSKLNGLSRSVAGSFDGRRASSSDETALTAAASASAVAGSYNLTVTALAQAQQTTSEGFSDPNAKIKEGTLQIKVGSGGTAVSVTVDSRNNTLQGLADAVNAAGSDVRAAIVNDGQANPYKLVLTSTKSGAANTIQITGTLSAGDGAAINPLAATIQEAKDAEVKLGSGAGALTVKSATNQVDTLIPGVTLNLNRADATKSLTLTVSNDTGVAARSIQDFVDSYNGVVDFLDARDDYNSDTKEAGVLLGSRDAADLGDDLAAALTGSVAGVKTEANRLAAVGITFTDKGRLELNQTKLNQALAGQVAGVSLTDVKRLFALTGAADNPGASFVLGSDKTKPSGAVPYQVNVTTPATRAAISGSRVLVGDVTLTSLNNSFTLQVNNLSSSLITLDPGTYTPQALAAAMQTQINLNVALRGNQVAVDFNVDRLRLTSQVYGSASQLSFGAEGTAVGATGPLGFDGPEAATGTNVAGNFVVNGTTETATGAGQVLTGASGNVNTDGLQVRATFSAAATASVTVTQGLASRLNQVLNKYVDPVNGRLKTLDKGFTDEIADIDTTITKQNNLMDEKKEQLVLQFAAMESTVNTLKGLGNQIAASFGTPSSK